MYSENSIFNAIAAQNATILFFERLRGRLFIQAGNPCSTEIGVM
jgi:hypothetical protein